MIRFQLHFGDSMTLPSGTVTHLFTDLEGSTRLWQAYPEAMKAASARHDHLMREALAENGGKVVKTTGDGFHAAFSTAAEAVHSTLQAQQVLLAEAWEELPALRVRMGLHTCSSEFRDGDYYSASVNRAARLMSAGHGGQVLLSQATVELVRDGLPPEAALRDLGEHRLKDLTRPERIYQLEFPGLPSDFPPLLTLNCHPHNLPLQATSFVGREKELEEVKRLLSATRLLTLTGSGGAGKSRLSLQVAADVLEAYPQGVWLVELAALSDPEWVLPTVAGVLGVRESASTPLLTSLIHSLKTRQLLLVLDNCEHLLQPVAELAEALLRNCPEVKLLASSREGLGIAGEVTYRIPSLTLPRREGRPSLDTLTQYDAVRLFIDRAAAVQPSFQVTNENAPALAHICHRLDGIPLALELAASRVRVMTLEQIASRLDDRFRLLTGGSRTALPRQQTLRALIDWSYNLLNDAEQELLRNLSVFSGGWTLEAAEAVGAGDDVEEWEALDLRTGLVDKSLVQYEGGETEGRYRLLETLRHYGRERLMEAGEAEAVHSRHCEYYLQLAESGCQDESELDNWRAALEWCIADPEGGEKGLQLFEKLRWYWFNRGHWDEAAQRAQSILSHPGVQRPTRTRHQLLIHTAWIRSWSHDFAVAEALAQESLDVARVLKDPEAEHISTIGWGMIAQVRGDHEVAIDHLSRALEMAKAHGFWLGQPLCCLGWAYSLQGNLDTAREYVEEALALDRAKGGWGAAIFFSGILALQRRDVRLAEERLREGLTQYVEVDQRTYIQNSLKALGAVSVSNQSWVRAARLFGAAERMGEKQDVHPDRMISLWFDDFPEYVSQLDTNLEETLRVRAWREGRSMSFEDAVAYALSEAEDA